MQQITPRWEWRAFGRRFREAEARQATLTPEGAPASDTIYLLCAAGGNVKVRNALVDIKILKQVNAQGLEQWMPIMKAAFPLAAAETAQLFDTLGLAGPSRSGAPLHARRFHSAVRAAGWRDSRSEGPQATNSAYGRWLHG